MAELRINKATLFIMLIGIVSLFADFTYEGARSIIPQYFTFTLGGSVFLLGVVMGFGDFLGYAFRLVSGRLADLTRGYWKLIFLGYAINLFAVPLLALSGNYITAALLIFLERLGKATRSPPKDYMVSAVSAKGRMGRSFAIQQALDQTGAILGPLVLSAILLYNGNYRFGFAFLAIPATLAMIALFITYKGYGRLHLSRKTEPSLNVMSFRKFLLYSIAIAISAAGFYQISFILYGAQGVVSTYLIPIIFLTAMVGEGLYGFVFGLLYDRMGRKLVYLGIMLPALIPLTLLTSSPQSLFMAALIIGATTGIQDTVMKSVVGSLIPLKSRGFAYGIFNAFYGLGLLASGAVIGYLYYSLNTVIGYILIMQIASLVMLSISFRPEGLGTGH